MYTCKNCEKNYQLSDDNDILFCSKKCGLTFYKSSKNTRKASCNSCGREYIKRRSDQKYCCMSCGKKAWENKKIAEAREAQKSRVCKFCLKEFIPDWFYNGKKHVFCSFRCKEDYHKSLKRQKNKEKHELSANQCLFCNNQFTPRRRVDEKYCSNECKTNYHAEQEKIKREERRANTIRTCPICDKQFSPKRSLKEIYCSPNCRKCISRKIHKMMSTLYKRCGTKKENHAHEVLQYSAVDLLKHLQKFPQWEDLKHDTWHLDHIFPIVAFTRIGITDISLICCLENLQPLGGSENSSKNDKYDQEEFNKWITSKGVTLP